MLLWFWCRGLKKPRVELSTCLISYNFNETNHWPFKKKKKKKSKSISSLQNFRPQRWKFIIRPEAFSIRQQQRQSQKLRLLIRCLLFFSPRFSSAFFWFCLERFCIIICFKVLCNYCFLKSLRIVFALFLTLNFFNHPSKTKNQFT